jgi:hypothetical protein
MGYKKHLSFESPKRYEPADRGVDLVGAKYVGRGRRRRLEIILVQVKGGKGNKVTEKDRQNLRSTKKALSVRLAGAEKPGTKMPKFFEL